MSYDPETRPSVGKDVHQDPAGKHPPPAPDNTRQRRRPASADTSNPDPGYPDQMAMNRQNPDEQQNRGERPRVQQPDEATRKAEIRKAVKEDMIDSKNAQGQRVTDYSGGT